MKNIFKTTAIILLLIVSHQLKAQNGWQQIKKAKTEQGMFNSGKFKSRLKNMQLHTSSFRLFSNNIVVPKVSVDLLNGSGIHLFTISDVASLPTVNVGARIEAGITIHL